MDVVPVPTRRGSKVGTSAVAIAVVLCVVLAGCGGSSNSRAATVAPNTTPVSASASTAVNTAPTPGTTAAVLPTRRAAFNTAELNGALLRVSDLPSGFTSAPPTPSTSSDTQVCNQPDPTVTLKPSAQAEADFKKSELGPFVFELMIAWSEPSTAKSFLDRVRAAAGSCTSYQTTDNGETDTSTVSPLPFPKLGDDTVAVRLSVSGASLPADVDVAAIRKGPVALLVVQLAVGAIDSAITEQAARAAMSRATNKLSL
jgi:hypothetical protein